MSRTSNHLFTTIENASAPELKEVLRRIRAICINDSNLADLVDSYTQCKSTIELRKLLSDACEMEEECTSIMEQALKTNEKDRLDLSDVEVEARDITGDDSGDLAAGLKRKRGSEVHLYGKRARTGNKTPRSSREYDSPTVPQIPDSAPSNNNSQMYRLSQAPIASSEICPTRKPSSAPTIPQKKSKSISSIFAADAARRIAEALEQEAQIKEVEAAEVVYRAGFATCAQCHQHYKKSENTQSSCVFHPGVRRTYRDWRMYHATSSKYFCCGRFVADEGCMEAKHIDDSISGKRERISAIYLTALEALRAAPYGVCKTCWEDMRIEPKDDEDEEEEKDGTRMRATVATSTTYNTTNIQARQLRLM